MCSRIVVTDCVQDPDENLVNEGLAMSAMVLLGLKKGIFRNTIPEPGFRSAWGDPQTLVRWLASHPDLSDWQLVKKDTLAITNGYSTLYLKPDGLQIDVAKAKDLETILDDVAEEFEMYGFMVEWWWQTASGELTQNQELSRYAE